MRQIASNQTRGLRQIFSQGVASDNQQFQIDIPRGPANELIVIRISGTINNSVAWTAARNLAPYYLFRRIDWRLNSNVTLDSISGPQAFMLMSLMRRNVPTALNPAAGVGAQTIDATVILDRAGIDMVRPKDSLLKTDVGVSSNQLVLQLGALANMFTGAGTSAYTAVTLSVSLMDYQEARDPETGATPAPSFYLKRNGFQQSYAAAPNQAQIKINTGNRLRLVSIRNLDNTTLEPVNTLTRLRLIRAGDTRFDVAAADLLQLNRSAYGPALVNGQYVLDLANPGNLGVRYSEFWPIPSSADTFLVVDGSAATTLDIATLEGVDL